MSPPPRAPDARWADAVAAAMLLAVDPAGLGGVVVRARPGEARQRWLDGLHALAGDAPFRKLPGHIGESRLLGGLDLTATLQAGRPVVERGLLAQCDGGYVIATMAERIEPAVCAHLTAALDTGVVAVERDGVSLRADARFGLVALDEGLDDESAPAALAERLAFWLDLDAIVACDLSDMDGDSGAIAAARARIGRVRVGDESIEAICAAAMALGIGSLRAPSFAIRSARAAAALDGRDRVDADDVALAARLVLAPRATQFPAPDENEEPSERPPEPDDAPPPDETADSATEPTLDDIVLAAAQAAIPPDLLARLRMASQTRAQGAGGKAGVAKSSPKRGRPAGVRRGDLRAGGRLSVIETLRAAAPWQRLRNSLRGAAPTRAGRLIVHKDDIRIARFKRRSETVTIFAVDASGSSAMQRLAEVKGAVELVLADCYVRRDQVALIAFRGTTAELLLPPTRSLTRAKRCLAALPGGGGTPIALAIDRATALALLVRSKGQSPAIVLMTDGRANIRRDGSAGRAEAEAEALASARILAGTGLPAILVDTSPRPQKQGQDLAAAMNARYVALPYANAQALSRAVQEAV